MQTLKSIFISFTFFLLAFSSSCFAVGTTYQGIFQTSATTGENPLQNTLFNRDTYDGIGSAVWITGAYDVDGNYIVPVGSTWTWYLYRIEDEKGNSVNQLLSEHPITYQGEVGSCTTSWSNGWC